MGNVVLDSFRILFLFNTFLYLVFTHFVVGFPNTDSCNRRRVTKNFYLPSFLLGYSPRKGESRQQTIPVSKQTQVFCNGSEPLRPIFYAPLVSSARLDVDLGPERV